MVWAAKEGPHLGTMRCQELGGGRGGAGLTETPTHSAQLIREPQPLSHKDLGPPHSDTQKGEGGSKSGDWSDVSEQGTRGARSPAKQRRLGSITHAAAAPLGNSAFSRRSGRGTRARPG